MIGDIIFSRFPFADQPRFKERPSLVISQADERGDFSVLKISSKDLDREGRVVLKDGDFEFGGLSRDSAVDLTGVTRINAKTVTRYVGKLKGQALQPILKSGICQATRDFSKIAHIHNRPGSDELHPYNVVSHESGVRGSELGVVSNELKDTHHSPPTTHHSAPAVPYAGRVFTEDEVEAAVSSTLDFWLTLGSEGAAFEKELADYLGVKSTVLTNSGSSANLLAVSALTTHKLPKEKRLLPGDEVITCAAGFPTTVAPILQNNLVPVFLDNDPVTGNADLSRLEEAYVPGKTKAVMMAHTLGNPFDLATVCKFCHEHDLWLIEDNCDALGCTYTLPLEKAKEIGLDHLIRIAKKGNHPLIRITGNGSGVKGSESKTKTHHSPLTTHHSSPDTHHPLLLTAPTGTFGHLSTQSFYPPHHLTMGEGGAVNIIRKAALRIYVESFRDWGRDCWCPSGKDNTCNKRFGWQLGELPEGYDHKYIYSHLGYNVKPLDPQAAIGRKQIEKLPSFIQARKENWEYLRRGLEGLEDVFEFSLPTHATRWVQPADRRADVASAADADDQKLESVFEWDAPSSSLSDLPSSRGYSVSPSWFGFMLLVKPDAPFTKSEFAAYLDQHKIGNRMLFGGNLLRQPAFVQLKKDRPEAFRVVGSGVVSNGSGVVGSESGVMGNESRVRSNEADSTHHSPPTTHDESSALPGADRIMNEAIFIGTYPGLTKLQLDHMITTIREFVAGCE